MWSQYKIITLNHIYFLLFLCFPFSLNSRYMKTIKMSNDQGFSVWFVISLDFTFQAKMSIRGFQSVFLISFYISSKKCLSGIFTLIFYFISFYNSCFSFSSFFRFFFCSSFPVLFFIFILFSNKIKCEVNTKSLH